MSENEVQLGHVHPAHMLGQARCGGLVTNKVLRRLRAVARGKHGGHEEICCFFDDCYQLATGNLAKDLSRPLGLAHVAGDETAICLADFGKRLSGHEMYYRLDL